MAVNHLVAYLQKRKAYEKLSDLLTSCGRYDEAGVVQYQQALTLKNIDDKSRRIKTILRQTIFTRHPDAEHLVQHGNLLERISPVIASDTKNSEIGKNQNHEKIFRIGSVSKQIILLFQFHDKASQTFPPCIPIPLYCKPYFT